MIRVRFPARPRPPSVNMDYLRPFLTEFEHIENVRCVGPGEEADLSFLIPGNCKVSVLLDQSDVHSNLPIDICDKLLNQKMVDYVVRKGIPIEKLTPSKVWPTRPDKVAMVDDYGIWAPSFFNKPMREFSQRLKRAKVHVVPISIPESFFYYSKEKTLDVYFAGAIVFWYPYREDFLNIVRQLSDVKSLLNGYTNRQMYKACVTQEMFDKQLMDYADNLRRAKITFADGGIFNYPLRKHFEAMGCGCLLMCPMPEYGKELGFIDGETFVEADPSNFEEKLRYYLANDRERIRITDNAYSLFRDQYTCKASALSILREFCSA